MSHPRVPLGSWPTRVERMERVSSSLGVEVWAKREDTCGTWGGNKVRKLEHILGAARHEGIEELVGFGVGRSNWTSALAYHGSASGFRVSLHLSGPVPEPYRRLYRTTGTSVISVRRPSLAFVGARTLLPARGRTRVVGAGGSGGVGDIGSMGCGAEVARSVRAGEIPRPALAFVAAGTGGTAAGLALGAAAQGIPVPVMCVRAAPLPFGTPSLVRMRVRALRSRLLLHEPSPPIRGDARFFPPGYGRPNAAAQEARSLAAEDGVELDLTYGAKAFAALIAAAKAHVAGPLLFIHTSPGPVPEPA